MASVLFIKFNVETAAIKNIVTRVLLAKGKMARQQPIAIERVAEFLEGWQRVEPRRKRRVLDRF